MSTNVDWPALLGDLAYLLGEEVPNQPQLRVALGTPRLAEYLGITRGKLRNILDGTKVEYDEGTTWIAMWCRLTGKSTAFVPRAQRAMSSPKFFPEKAGPDIDARGLPALPWGAPKAKPKKKRSGMA